MKNIFSMSRQTFSFEDRKFYIEKQGEKGQEKKKRFGFRLRL